jgi:hypothetical protein
MVSLFLVDSLTMNQMMIINHVVKILVFFYIHQLVDVVDGHVEYDE